LPGAAAFPPSPMPHTVQTAINLEDLATLQPFASANPLLTHSPPPPARTSARALNVIGCARARAVAAPRRANRGRHRRAQLFLSYASAAESASVQRAIGRRASLASPSGGMAGFVLNGGGGVFHYAEEERGSGDRREVRASKAAAEQSRAEQSSFTDRHTDRRVANQILTDRRRRRRPPPMHY
jgi:hypothetical protein